MTTFAICDVAGDDPALIGSGSTVARAADAASASAILRRYGLPTQQLEAARRANLAPPLRSDDRFQIIADADDLVRAAARAGAARGLDAEVISSAVAGEAKATAALHADIASRADPSTLLVSGGELTTVLGEEPGTGGPNHD